MDVSSWIIVLIQNPDRIRLVSLYWKECKGALRHRLEKRLGLKVSFMLTFSKPTHTSLTIVPTRIRSYKSRSMANTNILDPMIQPNKQQLHMTKKLLNFVDQSLNWIIQRKLLWVTHQNNKRFDLTIPSDTEVYPRPDVLRSTIHRSRLLVKSHHLVHTKQHTKQQLPTIVLFSKPTNPPLF